MAENSAPVPEQEPPDLRDRIVNLLETSPFLETEGPLHFMYATDPVSDQYAFVFHDTEKGVVELHWSRRAAPTPDVPDLGKTSRWQAYSLVWRTDNLEVRVYSEMRDAERRIVLVDEVEDGLRQMKLSLLADGVMGRTETLRDLYEARLQGGKALPLDSDFAQSVIIDGHVVFEDAFI